MAGIQTCVMAEVHTDVVIKIETFPRKGIYYKISSTRNRNVKLASKCMAN